MLALLTPAPSAPPHSFLLSPLQGGYAWQDPWDVPPQNTPGLGHQAEPFLLTTLRGRDPQWARCTGTTAP